MSRQTIDLYDGTSGAHILTCPEDCALDCSQPGQSADENVAHWRSRVTWHADAEALRRMLCEYGAWDDLNTCPLETLQDRALWVLSCDYEHSAGYQSACGIHVPIL